MVRLSKNNRLLLRSTFVTFFMLSCAFVAVVLMGKAYSEMQKILFDNETEAMFIVEEDVFSFFGNEVYLPVMTYSKKVAEFFKTYASGIIKLIGYAVNITNELLETLVNYFTK